MDHNDNGNLRMDGEAECDNWKVGCQLKVESRLPAGLVNRLRRNDAVAILRFGANAVMLDPDFGGLDSVARTEGFDA
jgi:hypothetical protein